MSLLGELLGPCRVGSYLFGCFILFFPPFPSPPFACRVPRRGGGTVGLAGSPFPSLSGEKSGEGEAPARPWMRGGAPRPSGAAAAGPGCCCCC